MARIGIKRGAGISYCKQWKIRPKVTSNIQGHANEVLYFLQAMESNIQMT